MGGPAGTVASSRSRRRVWARGTHTIPGKDSAELRLDAIDALGSVRHHPDARSVLERLARSMLPTPARSHARLALGETSQ